MIETVLGIVLFVCLVLACIGLVVSTIVTIAIFIDLIKEIFFY